GAYRRGYYPMAKGATGKIGFYAANPRGIIPLDDRFTIRRSLRQALKKKNYEVRFDSAFDQVIRNCSRHGELSNNQIWLSDEMIALYTEIHRRGIAHSVETWMDGDLAGGLYGLALGAGFMGE